jgi:hypothetical protein
MIFPIIEVNQHNVENISEIELRVNNILIENNDDVSVAMGFGKSLKDLKKRLEEERTNKVKPFNDHVKEVNARYKPIIEKTDNLCKIIEQKLNVYRIKLQKIEEEKIRRQREEQIRLAEIESQKKLEEAVELLRKNDETSKLQASINIEQAVELERNNDEIRSQEIEVRTKIKTDNSSLTVRKTWEFEVITKADVPIEYLIVDEQKIRKAINSGVRVINGVNIYQKEQSYIK